MKQAIAMIVGLVVFVAVPQGAFGQLSFESSLEERTVDAAEDTYEVEFPFSNKTDDVIRVEKVDTSCGCLKAESDKEVVKPGESGVVAAVFTTGTRTGTFEKLLKVKTALTGEKSHVQELRFRVTIPEVMVIEPKLVSWELGEEPGPKALVLNVKSEDAIRVVSVECSREGFRSEVHTVEEGRKYRIEVTPESTKDPIMGLVRIDTDCKLAKFSRQLAFFSVKRPRS